MRILVLDDRGTTLVTVLGRLRRSGHEVEPALNCYEAETKWKRSECLIIDLQLPRNGLTEEESLASQDGFLTGWIWLKHRVLYQVPQMAERTIIFSAYTDTLQKYVKPEEIGNVSVLAKGNGDEPLVKRAEEISRLPSIGPFLCQLGEVSAISELIKSAQQRIDMFCEKRAGQAGLALAELTDVIRCLNNSVERARNTNVGIMESTYKQFISDMERLVARVDALCRPSTIVPESRAAVRVQELCRSTLRTFKNTDFPMIYSKHISAL